MAYTKNALATGATITKAALDNMENGIAAAAERPTSGTASSSTFFRGDGVWATPPTGGGGGTAAPGIVYAASPPSGSGLTAVAADNSTEDAARIQAMLTWVKDTYGGGRVVLPSRTIKVSSNINIPSGVTLTGSGATVLNCAGIGGGTAITLRGKNALLNMSITGPNGTDKTGYVAGTSCAINLSGIGTSIHDVDVTRFGIGLDTTNNDTFGVLVDNCSFGNCGVGVDMDQSAGHNGGNQVTENGERMVFQNCVFWNSQKGVVASGSGIDAFFFACSFDYLGVMVECYDAFIHLIGCHLETGYAAENNNWGAQQRYLMQAALTARFEISNCRFEIRDTGVYAMMTPEAGPATYNSGFVRLDGTNTWYGQLGNGETRQFNDRDMHYWAAGDTTKKVYNPFLSKWSPASARYVACDGTAIPAGHIARISAMSVSTNAGVLPDQSVTISRELLGGATAAAGWVEVVC